MNKKDEECEQTICTEGDATGSYRKFAQKRFKNMQKLYEDDLNETPKQTTSQMASK